MGPRSQKKSQEFLSESERVGLEDQKRELEAELKNEEKYGKEGIAINTATIQRQIKSIDHAIETRTPGRTRGADKDKLVKEEKELEEKISAGMPTDYEMRQPNRNPGAVRKHMNWDKRNVENINRYRQIQRILRPGEPKSIENLRKEK
jgi:hypothetical protein